jgi:hypothetical protein
MLGQEAQGFPRPPPEPKYRGRTNAGLDRCPREDLKFARSSAGRPDRGNQRRDGIVLPALAFAQMGAPERHPAARLLRTSRECPGNSRCRFRNRRRKHACADRDLRLPSLVHSRRRGVTSETAPFRAKEQRPEK